MNRAPATDLTALRNAVNDEPASTAGAWAAGPAAVEGFLRRIVDDLNRLPSLIVHHAEFGHYGSGYASYVDVLLTKREGSMRRSADGWTEVEGLPLTLCRLAPLAARFALDVRSSGPGGSGARGLPRLSEVTDTAPPGWEQECHQVDQVLDRHRITLLGLSGSTAEGMIRSLPQPPTDRLTVNTPLAIISEPERPRRRLPSGLQTAGLSDVRWTCLLVIADWPGALLGL
ncbi:MULTISPECIES: hypothetical protein [Streptosporangium]|uniref:Uncharacterized protein n=1 Tax=Streptosporangium brasiliense TaxID=47480 RepID=A0ABT9R238_9ACTN|nr:hypothetical protein [Streptosporangium brasiliense]MDP9863282.1 hypothetical protein [Streptosporangium brasiliense]